MAASVDSLDEFGAGRKREILAAPKAKALRVGQVMDRGRAGRRDVDDARVRQGVLKPKARTALLRGGDVVALALAACGVLHGVALVEDDHSIEVGAQPFRNLLDAGKPLATVVGRSEEHTSELQSIMRTS